MNPRNQMTKSKNKKKKKRLYKNLNLTENRKTLNVLIIISNEIHHFVAIFS